MHSTARQFPGIAILIVAAFALFGSWLVPVGVCAQEQAEPLGDVNRVLSVTADSEAGAPRVHIQTADPVGFRYSVYESTDPQRIVIDFPRMDVSEITSPLTVNMAPVNEIRVISFDLTMGKLGRVEVLVDGPADYDVSVDGDRITLAFAASSAQPAQAARVSAPVVRPQSAVLPETSTAAANSSATLVQRVAVNDGRIAIDTDGEIAKYRYFNLSAPPRLVVDIFDVKPAFSERSMHAGSGFDRLRIGTYDDKTRFVLDAGGAELPGYTVDKKAQGLLINWQPVAAGAARGTAASAARTPAAPARNTAGTGPVSVDNVEFEIVGDKSVFTVTLSGPAQVSEPSLRNGVVLFGFDNGTIKNSLRRVIDTSAFPSAIEMVTPYTVNRGNVQDVRFAARLKGDMPYRLRQVGNQLIFEVENGPFAQQIPGSALVELPVAVKTSAPAAAPSIAPVVKPAAVASPAQTMHSAASATPEKKYTGRRISLVFDNADVRNLLQLIAEVSNLNIIAGEEVKGNISIRLIDVPWDQALDVILDIRQLGMLRDGNVVRILPKAKIREMEEADMTAARSRQDLEPLVTEVFSVSYTNLGNISGPIREVMTERGRLTQDERNKKIIVRDIPAVMDDVRTLIGILDTPERQVMIEARIVEASSDFVRDLGVNWGFSSATYKDTNRSRDSFNAGMGGNFLVGLPSPGLASTGAGLGVRFGEIKIDNAIIDLRISALESSGRGKIISRPRVTTLNGQEAVITQGTTIPYQTSGADGPKTEFVDATLELKVIPIINPDNSIIMEIQASNSAPGESFTTADLPGINKKEAKTKVLIFDGDTTVIGGIFVENDGYSETGVPWLMKIPFLGHAFKSQNVTKRRSELLIFITPRILE